MFSLRVNCWLLLELRVCNRNGQGTRTLQKCDCSRLFSENILHYWCIRKQSLISDTLQKYAQILPFFYNGTWYIAPKFATQSQANSTAIYEVVLALAHNRYSCKLSIGNQLTMPYFSSSLSSETVIFRPANGIVSCKCNRLRDCLRCRLYGLFCMLIRTWELWYPCSNSLRVTGTWNTDPILLLFSSFMVWDRSQPCKSCVLLSSICTLSSIVTNLSKWVNFYSKSSICQKLTHRCNQACPFAWMRKFWTSIDTHYTAVLQPHSQAWG